MSNEFQKTLAADGEKFGVELDEQSIERLAGFYEIVAENNPLLHLVAPCSAEEFARRHILESLTMLEFLPPGSRFCDVGTGAGLPAIPCLLVRSDLKAELIESKEKKARYLTDAVEKLGIADRAKIINKQFEEADPGKAEFVTCRALDKFTQKLPKILRWSKGREKLFFGGPNLHEALIEQGFGVEERLMPMSEQRFLFRVGTK
jgi:16S rRNA (guanine527-N7)-methyltransferase